MKVIKHHIQAGFIVALMAFSSNVAGAADAEVQLPRPSKIVEPSVAPDAPVKQGTVTVLFKLDESGRPLNIEVESATNTELAESVRSALKKWRFVGGPEGEKLETSKFRMPVVFALEG